MEVLPHKVTDLIAQKKGLNRVEWIDDSSLLPNKSGVYALKLELDSAKSIEVGALGAIYFESGFYFYIGSAKGAGGLAARIGRHFNRSDYKKKRWHIDYVRAEMTVLGCWIIENKPLNFNDTKQDMTENVLECELAQAFIDTGCLPFEKVGSSDCQCIGHLMKVAD